MENQKPLSNMLRNISNRNFQSNRESTPISSITITRRSNTLNVPSPIGNLTPPSSVKRCRCGSLEHLNTKLVDCPLNTSINHDTSKVLGIPKPKKTCFTNEGIVNIEILTPPTIKQCKCGSTSHLYTSNRSCPLNKKNHLNVRKNFLKFLLSIEISFYFKLL